MDPPEFCLFTLIFLSTQPMKVGEGLIACLGSLIRALQWLFLKVLVLRCAFITLMPAFVVIFVSTSVSVAVFTLG